MHPADVAIHLLFVGNSLTAANDLPATVEAIGRAAGVRIECTAIAKPDFSLEDHWNDGEARKAIARGGWTFVILQQGPSALLESRALLDRYVKQFDAEIRQVHARTAIYMVWLPAARLSNFNGVHTSYTEAAALVGGLLLPAGDAWREAWRMEPSLGLYGDDGFHPSPMGSYLAALVIVRGVTGRGVAGIRPPPYIAPRALPILERAVDESFRIPAGRHP
jgi:hypothetical protein